MRIFKNEIRRLYGDMKSGRSMSVAEGKEIIGYLRFEI
jgi:hypothetical protein